MTTCARCNKEFSSKQRLNYHYNNVVCGAKHLGRLRTTFTCRMCDKMFTSNQRLQYHQNNLVCVKQDRRCKFCNKTLSSLRNFKQHKCRVKEDEIKKFRFFNKDLSEDTIGTLLDERRELSQTHKDFDIFVSWYCQNYWCGKCPDCGYQRKEDHIVKCGIPCIYCGAAGEHLCSIKAEIMSDLKFIKKDATEDDLKQLIRVQRIINLFIPGFELKIKMWFNRRYWEGKCDDCGFIRSEEHLTRCLI